MFCKVHVVYAEIIDLCHLREKSKTNVVAVVPELLPGKWLEIECRQGVPALRAGRGVRFATF